MMYLLIKATNTPAPIGSNIVGIIEGTENYYGDGSGVTGCIPTCEGTGVGGGAVFGRYPSPSVPPKPAYKSAMLP
jgi:hypothetical protein